VNVWANAKVLVKKGCHPFTNFLAHAEILNSVLRAFRGLRVIKRTRRALNYEHSYPQLAGADNLRELRRQSLPIPFS
jgi:hypothetical protein